MNNPFRIDILDENGDKVGSGPLVNVSYVSTTVTLDKIGSAFFAVPASDPKAREIQPGRMFDIFDEVDGYLGRFIYQKATISDIEGQAMMNVTSWSMLKQLTRYITGFARQYESETVEDIAADLLSDVPGWTSDFSIGADLANVTYQGQTIYQAIEEITKRWGYHFRLGASAQELALGAFGTLNTDVRLTNLGGQAASFDAQTDVAIIKTIQQSVSDEEVYNRVIALGAGEGAAQLRLLDGEIGDYYTVDSRTRTNGQVETFIEDSASITLYGVREIVVIFDQVRPLFNNQNSKIEAATELLKNAERWLLRYKDARTQLDNVQVYGLKSPILVGDKVNIRYKGLDQDGNLYLDIDDNFWVMQHVRNRAANGNRTSNLQLVDIDRMDKTDMDLMAEAVRGIKSERLWIKPVAFRFSDTYLDTVQNANGDYQDKEAFFTITFDNTVTDVTRVIIEWRTRPLYTTAIWSNINPSQTQNANPTTPHLHNINLANTGTDGVFTVVTSDDYPTDVSLELNGVNIDDHADVDYLVGGTGPWNDGGTPNAALYVRMDITDLIVNDADGIYQTFELVVKLNAARTRDCAVPFWSVVNPTNNQIYGNQGFVEMKVLTQGVCQAVYKD